MYNKEDTIAAISTPIGEGAISIIRLSGKNSLKIANKIFSKPIKHSKKAIFGKIFSKNTKSASNSNILDHVVLLPMLKPNSYTGEDIIEIHCHANILILKKILKRVIQEGARLASPGEFTYRAFLNKKMDLSQAEAVQKLISAKNETALKISQNQLSGQLFKKISYFQKKLLDITSQIEAELNFPEDGLKFLQKEKIKKELKTLFFEIKKLEKTFNFSKALFTSLNLAIIGTVNVGKSSLMNILSQREKSIVTPIAGTTRDLIEEEIFLKSLNFKLIDTAGIRKISKKFSKNKIEKEGISKSKKIMKSADFIILVLDASKDFSSDDLDLIKEVDLKKTLIVFNKIDIQKNLKEKIKICKNLKNKNSLNKNFLKKNICKPLKISCKKNIAIENLKKQIENLFFKTPISKEEVILTSQRQKDILSKSLKFLSLAIKGFEKNKFLDLIAEDLRYSLEELSKIIKMDVKEDILSSIFSKFCIGK